MTRVGFIGLGDQGGPMARRVVEDGFPLTVWARRPESVEPFADTATVVASTPAEVGAASDVVGICVVSDADVEDVVLRADGVLAGMAPGGLVAIHSTVSPDTCRRLAEAAAARGVGIVDAPVSGGGEMAAVRQLQVMVGGADQDVERCRPVFETYGDPVIHLGPLGSGQMAKLVNNFVFVALLGIALDTYAFADSLGIDRAALAQVFAHGSGGSRAAATLASEGFDTTRIRAAIGLLRKDVGITLDVAAAATAAPSDALVDLVRYALERLEASA